MKKFLGNAFSLQMLKSLPATFKVEGVGKDEIFNAGTALKEDIESIVGHPDTARVLGVPYNRVGIQLEEGDTLYVAQLMGGRLPEGATTLPKGFELNFIKVTFI